MISVEVISSWTHPVNGRILPVGTKIDIDSRFFNAAFLKKEVKKKKTTTKKK